MFTDTTRSYVDFAVPTGAYYLVVYHRNHLPVMSAGTVNIAPTPSVYDFSTGLSKYYGGDAASLGGGVFGLRAGDADANRSLGAADLTAIRNAIGVLNLYVATDTDLNGGVGATDMAVTRTNNGKTTNVP
jgi:hypothetical protein